MKASYSKRGLRWTLVLPAALCLLVALAAAASQIGPGQKAAAGAQRRSLDPPTFVRKTLLKRDAASQAGANQTLGESHVPIAVPPGADFVSFPVGDGGGAIGAFWTQSPANSTASHAFLVIHGRLRDGNKYFGIMDQALQSAVAANFPGADPNSIIVAPEFFSTKLNSGQYTDEMLGWDDFDAWAAGDVATHPNGTQTSAFDVLDALMKHFSNSTVYPHLTNITLVGHGGGGQMVQRYAVVAQNPPSNVHVRYVFGDPSTGVYFGTERPVVPGVDKATCTLFNTWRYGFDNFTADTRPNVTLTPIEYFAQYIQRDVVELIGLQDVKDEGDQNCMAQLQGGVARRDRNLAYWKYINTLAQTSFNLTGFNATFDTPLPDWSNVSHNTIAHRLIIIANATHDPAEVLGSDLGRAALFSSGTLPPGWRPGDPIPAISNDAARTTVRSVLLLGLLGVTTLAAQLF